MTDERVAELRRWLGDELGWSAFELTPASADASFRRYFRAASADGCYIVMDAPPDKEDCRAFVKVAGVFGALGLNVPRVLAADLDLGFLLLTDLGSRLYLDELNATSAVALYDDALRSLVKLHTGGGVDLPRYDEKLLWNEMCLFRDWFVERQLGIELAGADRAALEACFRLLADVALEQPTVWVHRDYHSRNLLVTEHDNPGILDFQDAVIGPLTYDLVSLLRDCYIEWPEAQVRLWASDFYERLRRLGGRLQFDLEQFMRWFDLMGAQRHLKAIGIFSRLNLRDGKQGYLKDIPRTARYLQAVSSAYPGLEFLDELLRVRLQPRLMRAPFVD